MYILKINFDSVNNKFRDIIFKFSFLDILNCNNSIINYNDIIVTSIIFFRYL